MKFNKVLWALAVCVILSCAGEQKAEGKNILAVKASAAEAKLLQSELASFGTISYRIKNDITIQVGGIIETILVREGGRVNRGEPVALLKNVQLEIQYEQAVIALEQARSGLSLAHTRLEEARLAAESRFLSLEKGNLSLRQKELERDEAGSSLKNRRELWEIGGLTDEAYRNLELSLLSLEAEINMLKKDLEINSLGLRDADLEVAGISVSSDPGERKGQFIELNTRSARVEADAAEAALRNARKGLDSAARLMEELTIRSTVSGILGALYFEDGEYVGQNEKLATVMDISTVFGVFFIQEQDMGNIFPGAPLHLDIPSLGLSFDAGISEISPVADPQSGNFSVKAEIPNDTGQIRPGMFVKCRIPRGEGEKYPAIPESAVLQGGAAEETQVYCVVNNIAVIREIHVKAKKEGFLWVASGINEGDLVIDKPSPYLKEGMYVEYR
jgi:multidrug efflux pump subunit AcrA (membrane-fusion protein)